MKMEEQIAEFVRDNPVLWDKKHAEYKNMKAKDRQWFRLATILGIPVDTVKRRWKTMRDRYYRISKRQDVASIISNNGNRITKYKYGGLLHFLDDTQKRIFKTEPSISSDDSNHNCNDEQMLMINDKNDMKYEYKDTIATPEVIYPLEENEIHNNIAEHSEHLSKENYNFGATQERLNTARLTANFNNSPAHLFMLSLALQIDKANLSPEVFLNLQIKMLKLVQDEIKQQK
ncbi:hypothetical protein DOY81_008596 [Sarcophaga bullata]|nr:hypothetical protein DOY81_008596 [Sarcophaga bullata]